MLQHRPFFLHIRGVVQKICLRVAWNFHMIYQMARQRRSCPLWIQNLRIVREDPPGLLIVDKAADLMINTNTPWRDPVSLSSQIYYSRWKRADYKLFHWFRFCHQLDYATSGLICLAYDNTTARKASRCFSNRTAGKQYLALVWGHVSQTLANRSSSYPFTDINAFGDVIEAPQSSTNNISPGHDLLKPDSYIRLDLSLGRKAVTWSSGRKQMVQCPDSDPLCQDVRSAQTDLIVLNEGRYDGRPATKLLLLPQTGRQHQLRVHTLHLGHPIVGDCLYGGRNEKDHPRMMLHAFRLYLPMRGRKGVVETEVNCASEDPFVPECEAGWEPGVDLNCLADLQETFSIYPKSK